MKSSFLARRVPGPIRMLRPTYALLVLCGVFFLVPFGLRAARMAVQNKESDVKDWLPSDFDETQELAWFAKHFVGEQFIVATWEGCNESDQRLRLFSEKLRGESVEGEPLNAPADLARARENARTLGLLPPQDTFTNWAGQNEKWIPSESGQWYYVLPNGTLYRWKGESNLPHAIARGAQRWRGTFQLDGAFVAAFGEQPDQSSLNRLTADALPENAYYANPILLTSPLFRSVQTGPQMVKELSQPDTGLWPVGGNLSRDARQRIARRRALNRLTGTLFAPAFDESFDWSGDAFRQLYVKSGDQILIDKLPQDFETRIDRAVTAIVDKRFGGEIKQLAAQPRDRQMKVWFSVLDKCGVPPPPRQTCVLLTFTEEGQRNLPYVMGRGVLGAPRGRVMRIATEAGLQPAPSP
ncbi:MAG: hypothetical protein AAFP90_11650, partial [Planctomycetota bacterium]